MEDIKKCQCGGEVTFYVDETGDCQPMFYPTINCDSCGIELSGEGYLYRNRNSKAEESKINLIKAWNNRPIEDALTKEIADLKEVIRLLRTGGDTNV